MQAGQPARFATSCRACLAVWPKALRSVVAKARHGGVKGVRAVPIDCRVAVGGRPALELQVGELHEVADGQAPEGRDPRHALRCLSERRLPAASAPCQRHGQRALPLPQRSGHRKGTRAAGGAEPSPLRARGLDRKRGGHSVSQRDIKCEYKFRPCLAADFLATPTTCRFTGRSCITGSPITEVEIDVRQKVSIGFLRFALKNEAEIAGIISRQQAVHIISSVTGLMLPEAYGLVWRPAPEASQGSKRQKVSEASSSAESPATEPVKEIYDLASLRKHFLSRHD